MQRRNNNSVSVTVIAYGKKRDDMGLCAYLIPTKVPADARYQVAESNGWYYTYDTTNNELIDEEKYCTDVRERMVDLVTTLNRKEGMK